jgi:predicted DNA-binding protein (UPF0251 family)
LPKPELPAAPAAPAVDPAELEHLRLNIANLNSDLAASTNPIHQRRLRDQLRVAEERLAELLGKKPAP